MAASRDAPIERLPEELVLNIAYLLPDSATPSHLKNLSLVSRQFRPAAQEALHTTASLSSSCNCHPRVNAMARLLRTLLARVDLGAKVRTLRFRTVRKNVSEVYREQNFDLPAVRLQCLALLEKLGYRKAHPWWRSLENSIESAFGGVLLILVPNLTELDFWVCDIVIRLFTSLRD